jgi:hypothetical protein
MMILARHGTTEVSNINNHWTTRGAGAEFLQNIPHREHDIEGREPHVEADDPTE